MVSCRKPVNCEDCLSVAELRSLDQQAVALGLSERVLIENASSNLFGLIDELNLGQKVLVVAGRGNNGADVLACGRKLASRGYQVKIVVVSEKDLGPEALYQRQVLERCGLLVETIPPADPAKITTFLAEADFILEGILGVGLKGEVSGFLQECIKAINQSGKTVVACDIPSGLAADQGLVLGEAVKAHYTITFLAPKKAFFTERGRQLCGQVFVVDIGLSRELLERI